MLRTRVNHQIKAATVRVISDDGKQIGVMKLSEALVLAQEHGLDLVEVSPLAQPPVCKLIDIAKFRYQQKKAEQQQKKNAKKIELKTIWISVRISDHDMQIKAGKVMEFLNEGNVVKIELRMRGREQAFGDLGRPPAGKLFNQNHLALPHGSPDQTHGRDVVADSRADKIIKPNCELRITD